jgi:predicted nucleic acid-binding protein
LVSDRQRWLRSANGLVDAVAWYASLIPTDPDHSAATAWLSQNQEPLLTTDYMIDETLTLLKARGQKQRALRLAASFQAGNLGTIHFLTQAEFGEALQVFQRYADKEWSFTDCTSKVIIEKLGLAKAFTFDHHFRQFGTLLVVP